MLIEEVRKSYKSVLEQLAAIDAEAGDKPFSSDQEKRYDALLAEGKGLAAQIDRVDAVSALRAHAEKSAGTVVGETFGRETYPTEGDVPGVTADPNSGEMYAWKSVGEDKLRALKSGSYKDGLNAYIRSKALLGEDWRRSMKAEHMKVLNEGQDTAGGFWIPPDFRSNLISKVATITCMRPNATVITTSRDIVVFPAATYTTDDKYTSGVRFAWMGSAAQSSAIAESTNPVSGQARIPVQLAVAKILIQREQAEDNAFDMLGFVTQKMTEAFGLGCEDAYINGDGNAKPRGLANHPAMAIADGSSSAVNGVTYTGDYIVSGTSGAITWQGSSNDEPTKGILGMVGAVPPQYDAMAKWYGNKKTFTAIMGLKDTTNRPLWLNNLGAFPNITKGFPSELQGYPLARSQFFADIGADALPLYLGDMGGYYIVDRVALSVEVFRETYADRDQIMVYARMRTGGDLLDYWRMKVLKLSA